MKSLDRNFPVNIFKRNYVDCSKFKNARNDVDLAFPEPTAMTISTINIVYAFVIDMLI